MDEEEYNRKYTNLKILKSVQEYLKTEGQSSNPVYPIKVPDHLLYEVLKIQGPEGVDKLIHEIFRLGLSVWSETLYGEAFGSRRKLEEFIELVKRRNRE